MKGVEASMTKQLKLSDEKVRKWVLSIKKLLSSQNGDIIRGSLTLEEEHRKGD